MVLDYCSLNWFMLWDTFRLTLGCIVCRLADLLVCWFALLCWLLCWFVCLGLGLLGLVGLLF